MRTYAFPVAVGQAIEHGGDVLDPGLLPGRGDGNARLGELDARTGHGPVRLRD